MTTRRSLLSIALSGVALAAQFIAASAQQPGCTGKNMLDEFKSKDAATYTRIRQSADTAKNGKALLWKIENDDYPDRPVSYLYGTIHVTDDRLQPFSSAVENALSVSRRIALEVDNMTAERTEEALTAMQSTLLLSNNARLDQLLAKPEASRASVMLARTGLPKDWQPRVRPWVAAMLTATSDCERQRMTAGKLPLDAELARIAEDRGVGSFGLESPEMQLGALAAVPDADQVSLLKASLAAYDRIDDQVETLVQLYLARDTGAMWPLQLELGRIYGADPKAMEQFRQSVLVERNIRMRDRAMMHLAYGGVFIAIGAMHLPGDTGLVELLKDSGFKLTAIE